MKKFGLQFSLAAIVAVLLLTVLLVWFSGKRSIVGAHVSSSPSLEIPHVAEAQVCTPVQDEVFFVHCGGIL